MIGGRIGVVEVDKVLELDRPTVGERGQLVVEPGVRLIITQSKAALTVLILVDSRSAVPQRGSRAPRTRTLRIVRRTELRLRRQRRAAAGTLGSPPGASRCPIGSPAQRGGGLTFAAVDDRRKRRAAQQDHARHEQEHGQNVGPGSRQEMAGDLIFDAAQQAAAGLENLRRPGTADRSAPGTETQCAGRECQSKRQRQADRATAQRPRRGATSRSLESTRAPPSTRAIGIRYASRPISSSSPLIRPWPSDPPAQKP